MPTVIELDTDAITDESLARALLRLIEDLPGFVPERYDLNQRDSFRAWDLERAIVDLLTQRTQLFAVTGGDATVFIATGKHGEPPTLAFSGEIDAATLDPLLANLPVGAVVRRTE